MADVYQLLEDKFNGRTIVGLPDEEWSDAALDALHATDEFLVVLPDRQLAERCLP